MQTCCPTSTRRSRNSKLCPVFAVSATTLVGLATLLNAIVEYAPDPAAHEAEHGKNDRG